MNHEVTKLKEPVAIESEVTDSKESEVPVVTESKEPIVPVIVSERAQKLINAINEFDALNVQTLINKIAVDEIKEIRKIGTLTKKSIQGMSSDTSPQARMDNHLTKMKELITDMISSKYDPNPGFFTRKLQELRNQSPIQDFVAQVRAGEDLIGEMEASIDENSLKIEEEIITRTGHRKAYQAAIDVLKGYQSTLKEVISKYEKDTEGMTQEDKSHVISEIIMPLNRKLTNINNVILVNRQTDNSLKLTIDGNRNVLAIADTIKTVTLTALAANSQAAIALYEQSRSISQANDFNDLTNGLIVQNAEQQAMQLDQIEALLANPTGGLEALAKANEITLATINKQQGMKERVNLELKKAAAEMEKMDKELEDAMGPDKPNSQPDLKKIAGN